MRLADTPSPAPGDPPRAIRINGVEIAEAAIAQEAQHHPAPAPEDARDAAISALAVRELLLQQAERLEIEADPQILENGGRETEEDARVRVLLEREVAVPEPTVPECRRFYDINKERFRSPDIFEASHILFSANPADEAAYTAAREAAVNVIEQLQADAGQFEALAKSLSACPSSAQGGNLGQVTRGQTVPEFETFLFSLEVGQLCPVPVPTDFGVHVLRLNRKTEGVQVPFKAVQEKIADYLSDAAFHRAVHQYVAILAGQAEIEGVDLTRAESPLVQ